MPPPYVVYLGTEIHVKSILQNVAHLCPSSVSDRYRNRLRLAEQFELDHFSGITCWALSRTICYAIIPDKGNEHIFFFFSRRALQCGSVCLYISQDPLPQPHHSCWSLISRHQFYRLHPWQTLFQIGCNCKGETWQPQRMFLATSHLCISPLGLESFQTRVLMFTFFSIHLISLLCWSMAPSMSYHLRGKKMIQQCKVGNL